MRFKRKNVNKMIVFDSLWKNMRINRKYERKIKEVEYNEINLNEYIIIDVRSRREFREGHLNGAINIPLSDINKSIEKQIRNKESKILIYCQYGIRSKKAAEILEDLNYTQVYNLKNGLENI